MLTVELSSAPVTFIYKLPTADFNFPQPVPLKHDEPQVIIGNFSSHSGQWGYRDSDKEEVVEKWIDSNQQSLIHNPSFSHPLILLIGNLVKAVIMLNTVLFKRCFNYKKAD